MEGHPSALPTPREPRPCPPAVTGVGRRQLPAPAVTGAEPDWEKEAAKMKSCKGYNEIYAAVDSFMNGQDDNFNNIYCRYCPDTLFIKRVQVAVRQDNGHLTKAVTRGIYLDNQVKTLLKDWVRSYSPDVFGRNFRVINTVHLLDHLIDDYRRFGNLMKISAFKYENQSRLLTKPVRNNNTIISQNQHSIS